MERVRKSEAFLNANKEIVANLIQNLKFGKGKIRKNYASFYYEHKDVYFLDFYADNDNVKITSSYGSIDLSGIFEPALCNNRYINKKETADWKKKDWALYVKRTTAYLTAVLTMGKEYLHFCFEDYGNSCVYYWNIAKDIARKYDKPWLKEVQKHVCGHYYLNALPTCPISYPDSVAFTKDLTNLMRFRDKENKVVCELYDKYWEKHNTFVPDYLKGRSVLKALTPKEKERYAAYILTEEGKEWRRPECGQCKS